MTPSRSALWMYWRVFFRIPPRSSSGDRVRSMRRVRRGWTNTPAGRAPERSRAAASSGDGGTSGSARRPAQRSAASAAPIARSASGRSAAATSGPRAAYASVSPSGSAFNRTCATPARRSPSSRTKRRAIQPVGRFTSAHPADCRRCPRPVARTSSSHAAPSPAGTAVARRVRLFGRARGHGRFLRLGRQLSRGERAVRVALAAVEEGAAPAAPPHELALGAQRAGHAGLLLGLFDVLAVRIPGAADERSESTTLLREWLPALGAHLAFDDLRSLLLALERRRVVASTGRRRLALLSLHESGARVEASVTAELDDDRPTALRADLVGRLLGDIRFLDRRGLLLHERLERDEELPHDRSPLHLAARHAVQIELHPRREAEVDDVREVLGEEVHDREADVPGHEPALLAPHVVTIDERRDRRRVRRRAADAMLLERLHQRRLVEPRRRLREVLRSVQAEQLQLLALDDLREWGHFLLGFVSSLLIDPKESVERDAPAVRPQ